MLIVLVREEIALGSIIICIKVPKNNNAGLDDKDGPQGKEKNKIRHESKSGTTLNDR